ncbi:MAG: Rieske (2Fe-2S) protein [Gemmatimonadaceae bacterium]
MAHTHDGADCAATCPLAIAADETIGVEIVSADAPTRDGMGRRAFLSRSMLAAAAVALAACGTGDLGTGPGTGSVGGLTIKVSDYAALANVGGIALVNASGAAIAVVRTGASSFVALSRTCPHEGATVAADGTGGFTCPQHGARFNASGTWIGGQRTSNMRAYSTTYDAATGTLTIG